MQQRQNTHQSVGRSLEILMVFVPNNQELGTTDVSKKIGLHRSTLSRLLHALTHHGFLQQNPNNKKYSTILKYSAKGFCMLQVSFAQITRLPVHVAAGAKAILAFLPPEQAKRIIPKKLIRFTKNTITDVKVLLRELEEIRETGFAFDRGGARY